jgi:hypothetical protein
LASTPTRSSRARGSVERERHRDALCSLERRESVELGGEPPLRRRGARRAAEVATPHPRCGPIRPVGARDAEGIPLDADDPGREPAARIGPPTALCTTPLRCPDELAVNGLHRRAQLVAERGRDGRVEEPARPFGVRLVRQVHALDEVERRIRVGPVVPRQLAVERGRVDRVAPDGPDPERAHLIEPASVPCGGGRELSRLVSRRRRTEVDTRQEPNRTVRRPQHECPPPALASTDRPPIVAGAGRHDA